MGELPAGLSRRGSGYVVQYRREDGAWARKAVGPDLAHALQEHARLRGQVVRAPRGEGPSLAQAVASWLQRQEIRCKARTLVSSRHRARIVLRVLGEATPLARIDEGRVDRFVAKRKAEGALPATINADLRVLRAILRHAKSATRVAMVRAPRKKSVERFTGDELRWTMEAADARVRALLAICAETGVRLQEALHLQWRDVDLDDLTVQVRPKRYAFRARCGRVEEREWSPKSHQERRVAITDGAAGVLRRFRLEQRYSADDDWLFQSNRRPRERWTNPAKELRKALHLAGAYRPGRGTHAIRHSVATRMLGQGIDIETVRDILGHSTVTVTELYLHSDDESKRAAARAGSLLRGER